MNEERYIIIPSSNTAVDIYLLCAIQPGALAAMYSFEWRQLSPSPQVFSETTEILSVMVSPGEAAQYICIATIEHMEMLDKVYIGPFTTVNTRGEFSVASDPPFVAFLPVSLLSISFSLSLSFTVLSNLADDNITVTTGDTATFSCVFLRKDTDFNIIWKIGEFEYPCDSLQKDSGVQNSV